MSDVVSSGQTSSGIVVSGGVTETVENGGTAIDTTVISGGSLSVAGMASGTTVDSGWAEYVSSGGVASGTTISRLGAEYVSSGGTASDTTVSGGGSDYVFFGGTTIGTVVASGGAAYVFGSGTASGTAVRSAGTEYVFSGGSAVATTVSGGGSEYVSSGGTASATIVSSGGGEVVSSGGQASGIVLSAGGGAQINAGAVVSGIDFAGNGATLLLGGANNSTLPTAPISGFAATDAIVLGNVSYVSGSTATLLANNQLQVVENGTTLDLQLDPNQNFADATFSLAADSHTGGTDITTNAPPCYRAGTPIRTDHGDMPVEALRVGDRLVSAFGGTAAVVWLGHRRVDCRRHPRPQDVWPVRVRPGAFAPGVPRRDLFLSPDHAVFTGGALIPIRYLINGATIAQEPVDAVTYWHVELPTHDVLFAEGMPSESYLDTGNRGAFDNAAGPAMLHPDFALRVWEAEACARLVWHGAGLAAARGLLLDRAQMLGHVLTREPALGLRVDGRLLPPTIAGPIYRFRLPAGAGSIRLVSRSSAPAHMCDDSDDCRPLGVAVSRVAFDGEPIALTDARLGSGWHDIEGNGPATGWRWTDGDAGLLLHGGGCLDIEIAMTARYWIAPEDRRQHAA